MRSTISILFLSLVFFLNTTAFCQKTFVLKRYSIGFEIKNAGLKVKGSFKDLKTSIKFSSTEPNKSDISANIDVSSINTGIDLRDKHLKGDEYFNTAKYPSIQIKSKKIVALADGSYLGTFDLTIKNITKTVEIPFTFSSTATGAIFSGNFELDRRDYEVGGSSLVMGDVVKIKIWLETAGIKEID